LPEVGDTDSSDQDVIEYYNQRGAAEKIFDEMNTDFG
jgi:thiamine pyrophosphokinase